MRVRYAAVAALAIGLVLVLAPQSASAQEDFAVVPEEVPVFDPFADMPDEVAVNGALTDERGIAIAGATITAADQSVTSDADGAFALLPLPAATPVAITHPDHVARTLAARELYMEEDGTAEVMLPAYRHQFRVTPAGGTYRSGDIMIEVPEGAVSEPVTIRAARPPLAFGFDDRPGVQADRTLAVAFAPAGLVFAKPITVRLPAADGALVPTTLYHRDPASGLYAPDDSGSVARDGDETVLTLSHFSDYASGSPDQGMTKARVARTVDSNGDKRLTAQDAVLVVALWQGTHTAEWTQSITTSSAVMQATGSTTGTTEGTSGTVSAGASFGGVGVNVEHEVSKETSEEISKKVDKSASQSTTTTQKRSLHAPEYIIKCKYFLVVYDYWLVKTWRKHTPSAGEMRGIRQVYDDNNEEGEWGHMRIRGSQSIGMGTTLYGGNRLAVRKTGGKYEVYVMTGSYIVRTYAGFRTANCNPGNLGAKAKAEGRLRSFGGGQSMGTATYTPTATGLRSRRYLGWGILGDEPPKQYDDMECGVEASDTLTITAGFEETTEETATQTATESAKTSVSASVSVPLPGGASVGGGASAAKSSSETRSASNSYGRQFMSQVVTEIGWTIHNAHMPHLSDHLLAKLALLMETRDWTEIPREDIPREMRMLASQMRWEGGRAFLGTSGGGIAMRTDDGKFYAGGEPIITKREIGMALIRVAERPCGTPTITPTPETTPTKPVETKPKPTGETTPPPGEPTPTPGKPVTTPSPKTTPPADDRPPAATAPPPTDERTSATPRSYTRVEFTALAGETAVNRTFTGPITQVEFIAVDGKKLPPEEVPDTTAEEKPDSVHLTIPAAVASGVALVRLIGDDGTVELVQSTRPAAAAPGLVWPRDGMLDIRQKQVNETFGAPATVVDPSVAPTDHQVTLGGQPADVVAVRPDEVAVTSADAPTPTSSGRMPVEITGPEGESAKATVPAWSYEILIQPITEVGVWYPLHLLVMGLQPGETVEFEFVPTPTQEIQPRQVTVYASMAGEPQAVAQFQTSQIGPQAINVRVVKEPGAP